jgi:hypothetical protein
MGFGFFHCSRTNFCRAVPNLSVSIRIFFIAVCNACAHTRNLVKPRAEGNVYVYGTRGPSIRRQPEENRNMGRPGPSFSRGTLGSLGEELWGLLGSGTGLGLGVGAGYLRGGGAHAHRAGAGGLTARGGGTIRAPSGSHLDALVHPALVALVDRRRRPALAPRPPPTCAPICAYRTSRVMRHSEKICKSPGFTECVIQVNIMTLTWS